MGADRAAGVVTLGAGSFFVLLSRRWWPRGRVEQALRRAPLAALLAISAPNVTRHLPIVLQQAQPARAVATDGRLLCALGAGGTEARDAPYPMGAAGGHCHLLAAWVIAAMSGSAIWPLRASTRSRLPVRCKRALYWLNAQYKAFVVKPTRVGRDPSSSASSTRASVAIGFGSPSGDSGVSRLDLNDILVRHPQATFLMRIAGDAMREAGIDSGDLVLIDRAIAPSNSHVVIAVVGDEFVCRRLRKQGGELHLCAEDSGVPDIVADDGDGFHIWGVVTQVIKTMPV